jgi:hypothetical protein
MAGRALQGGDWRGKAGLDLERQARSGKARPGMAWPGAAGVVGHGSAGQGAAGQGGARPAWQAAAS